MKKLFSFLVANLSALAITISANGQNNFIPINESKSYKQVKAASTSININTQAVRKFKKDFPCITDDSWVLSKNQ